MCMRQANKRWRYTVTPSLINWAHTHNDPCNNKYTNYRWWQEIWCMSPWRPSQGLTLRQVTKTQFDDRIPDIQMNCSDLTRMVGFQDRSSHNSRHATCPKYVYQYNKTLAVGDMRCQTSTPAVLENIYTVEPGSNLGKVSELWLSCYLVLLSIDSKIR